MRRKVAVLLTAVCMLFTACSPSMAGGDGLAQTMEEDQTNGTAAVDSMEESFVGNRAAVVVADVF